MKNVFYLKAIQEALIEEIERDPSVFLMGEDIGEYGGCFGVTRGMLKTFGSKRVVDLPMSETSFMGMAVGAAITGLRPIVEIMFMDFITLSSDAIINHAIKLRYIFGGGVKVPLVIRAPSGAGKRYGSSHSQSLESLFMNFPGLKIVAPSTPADAKGLLKSAIRDDNPVLFIENKGLYWTKGNIPESECLIPIGVANIRREGCDVTIATYSRMVDLALEAAQDLATEGIHVEVLDLRSLAPLDTDTLFNSVSKTGRLVTLEEGYLPTGVGAELSSLVVEHLFSRLKSPIYRIACEAVPIPYSPVLEDLAIPSKDKVIATIKKSCNFQSNTIYVRNKWNHQEHRMDI
ncbi:MAG: alpha-ketoacid dehydrogenase subunit beta [Oligoflexia bacterium]|nr:alpha-ketoacid dehydrogenase subunit beta [Oligoflexia bacterium]